MKHIRVFVCLAFFLTGCFEQYQKVEPPIEIIASSETQPAPLVMPLSTKLPPTTTPETTATDTPTETSEPTATATELVLTEKAFFDLTDEEKQKIWNNSPSEIDGYSKSNFSTVLPYLILYRDANGDSQIALNLLTKEKSTLLEAGIAKFDFVKEWHPEGNIKGEFRAFVPDIPDNADLKTIENKEIEIINKMLIYIVESGVKWGDFSMATSSDAQKISKERLEELKKTPHPSEIPNTYGGGAFATGVVRQNSFWLIYYQVGYQGIDCTILSYKKPETEYGAKREAVLVAVQGDRLKELMMESKVTIPPNPQFIQTP